MMKQTPQTFPPSCSTRLPIASTVPPVASTSSWMSTREPCGIRSGCSSSAFVPYSSWYVALTVSGGSLPGRRAGTKPQPTWRAIAAPRMKPRASAPRIRSGFRSAAHVARRSIVSSSACRSASSGVTSLKPTPGCGQSGTSRIFAFRSMVGSLRDEAADAAPEETLRELLRQPGEGLEVLHPLPAPLGVARAECRRDDRLEQAILPVGRGAEGAEVPRRDPEAREAAADGRDVGVGLGVEALAARDARLQEAVFLELPRQARVDLGLLAERAEVELVLLLVEAACASASRAPRPRGSGSSRSRCPGTRASGARRPRRSSAAARGRVRASRSSEERQPVLADLQLVAVGERAGVDAAAVEKRAVEAAEVFDQQVAVLALDHRVPARDGHVVEEDVAVRRAADRRPVARERERLPRAAAAAPHDERRPLDADLLERGLPFLERLVGDEAHRRLTALLFREQRAALGAIVRRFRVLEAAFGTVDVAHALRTGARPCPSGSRSATRCRPARARSCLPTSATARRAPRAGCRSSRAGCGVGRTPPAPRASGRRSTASARRRTGCRDRGAAPRNPLWSDAGALPFKQRPGEGSSRG